MITNEQLNEIVKCRDSVEYFAENYIKIINVIDGMVNIRLNDYQKDIIDAYNGDSRSFYMHTPRQKGKTTAAAIIILHRALFGGECAKLVIAGPKKYNTDYILTVIWQMYRELPEWLTINKTVTVNKSNIEFEDLTSIYSIGSNFNAMKGSEVSLLYVDESEFVKNLMDYQMFIPTLMSGTKTKVFALSSSLSAELFGV